MSPRQSWVDARVDVLLAALHDLGMSASRAAATDLVHERVQWVSSQMGVSPTAGRRYLTDDALVDLARSMAFSVVDETPGADVIDSPRTAAVPLPILGRAIAGLAEAVQIRLVERDDLEHLRSTVGQLAQILSAVGQVSSDQPQASAGRVPVVMMPPGLVTGSVAISRPRRLSTAVASSRSASIPIAGASSLQPSRRTLPSFDPWSPPAPVTDPAQQRQLGRAHRRTRPRPCPRAIEPAREATTAMWSSYRLAAVPIAASTVRDPAGGQHPGVRRADRVGPAKLALVLRGS